MAGLKQRATSNFLPGSPGGRPGPHTHTQADRARPCFRSKHVRYLDSRRPCLLRTLRHCRHCNDLGGGRRRLPLPSCHNGANIRFFHAAVRTREEEPAGARKRGRSPRTAYLQNRRRACSHGRFELCCCVPLWQQRDGARSATCRFNFRRAPLQWWVERANGHRRAVRFRAPRAAATKCPVCSLQQRPRGRA